MDKVALSIVTAGRHFLYLPLYHAAYRPVNFFGLLPERYDLEIDAEPSRSDEEALRALLERHQLEGREVGFAVCDPTTVLSPTFSDTSGAIILASLVTNSAFWAVDHKKGRIRTLADLGIFDTIITYSEGTTGRRIAEHIKKESGKDLKIETVAMGNEILRLTQSPEGSLALSPNILEIDTLTTTNRGRYDIAFELASTPEYSNVLVSALITRSDVVAEHRDLVRALVEALQRSMVMVRYEAAEVIDCGKDNFGKPHERIRAALKLANESHVFPATVEVCRSHWANAARISREAQGLEYDEDTKRKMSEFYDSHVALQAEEVRHVIAKSILEPIRASRQHPRTWPWVALATVLAAVCVLAGLLLGSAPGASAQYLVGALALGVLLPRFFWPIKASLVKFHFVLWALATAGGALWLAGIVRGPIAGAASGVLIGGDLSLLVAAASRER